MDWTRLCIVGAMGVMVSSCVASVNRRAGDGGSGGAGGGVATDAPIRADTAINDTVAELPCGSGRANGNAGCDFYVAQPSLVLPRVCYAMVVVNPGTSPAKLKLQRGATTFEMEKVTRLPQGAGPALIYQPYSSGAGVPPGGVAIVFLAGQSEQTPRDPRQPPPRDTGNPDPTRRDYADCPFGTTAAVVGGTSLGGNVSGVGEAFHLSSDHPVVAYDVNPYGGAFSFITSASLLLPVETWTQNYVAPAPQDRQEAAIPDPSLQPPNNLLVIASQDGTEVSLRGRSAVVGGTGVPETAAGQTVKLRLDAGQFAQVLARRGIDPDVPSLVGTVLSSTKPVALVTVNPCLFVPTNVGACDGVHQQIPPLSAWGSEYAAIRHPSRVRSLDEEPGPWQIVAAVAGTQLTYTPRAPTPYAQFPAPAPTRLGAGESAFIWTDEPFVVRSQDADHPIYLAQEMTGCAFLQSQRMTPLELKAGDPEFVNVVPTSQYMTQYTLFTDPTYPYTSLTLVRKPGVDGRFSDVKLACASGPVTDWKMVGTMQYARVDLVRGDFTAAIPGCDNGVHKIASGAPFSVTVWGWGSSAIGGDDRGGAVSYAYPGGAGLARVTDVTVPIVE